MILVAPIEVPERRQARAAHDEADREEVTRAGADDFLAKPFDPADLLDRIERVLRIPIGARRHERLESADRLRRNGAHPDLPDDGAAPGRQRDVDRREEPARRAGADDDRQGGRRWWRRGTG
jgi:hypothetical protein